jgi:hypothetical protein
MLTDLHGADIHGSLDRALRRYVRADLLAIDDFAVLSMDPAQAKLAFQVIAERYDYRRATLITTNRPFKDWTKVFPDPLNAEVIAKRLTERAETFILDSCAAPGYVELPTGFAENQGFLRLATPHNFWTTVGQSASNQSRTEVLERHVAGTSSSPMGPAFVTALRLVSRSMVA